MASDPKPNPPSERVPERPKLVSGITESEVAGVLAELDGVNDIAGIAARTGMTPQMITALVAGLHAAGALEHADDAFEPPTEVAIDDMARAFLQRSIGATRSNRSWSEVEHRLATTPVRVSGNGPVVDELCDILRVCGIDAHRATDRPGTAGGVDALDVVVADDGEHCHEALTDLAPTWHAARSRRLVIGLSGNDIVLGPALDARFTACYSCATERAAVSDWRPARSSDESRLLAAMAATEVVALVSKVTRPVVLRSVVRLNLDTWEQDRTLLAPVPGCPTCLLGDSHAYRDLDASLVFDHDVSFLPQEMISPADRQIHEERGDLALQLRFEDPGGSTHALPDCPDPATSALGEEVADVGAILCSMVGLRPGSPGIGDREAAPGPRLRSAGTHVDRWSPTAGNLETVRGFVMIPRPVGSIPAGVHAYRPHHHDLAQLGPLSAGRDVLDGLAVGPETIALVVIVGGHNVARAKFDDFAMRALYLDAGAAAAAAVAIGTHRGLDVDVIDRWPDEQLETLLGLDRADAPITGLLRIGPSTSGTRS